MATKKLHIEKAQMKRWKQMIIIEVALKVQGIKQAHKEAIGIQRQNFQFKLEKLKKKLEIVESKSIALKEEIQVLKT